jgi:hypothetical protein
VTRKPQGQGTFAWEPVEESPPVPTESPPEAESEPAVMDVEGYRWWGSFCRSAQEYCITQASHGQTPEEMGEWAKLAKTWKENATRFEGRANQIEGS